MKKIALLALAASAAAIANPAIAQNVTGTITINGSVASKCQVVPVSGDGSTFSATVNLGELAKADGTLKTSADLSTAFNNSGGSALSARVVCTSALPKIAVNANPLVSQTAGGAGYTNTVHYTADVLVKKAATADQTYSNASDQADGTAQSIGDRFAASGNNVTVSTSAWKTTPNGTELLVAATDYTGQIVVTITPS